MKHANKNLLLIVALFGWATISPVVPDAAAHDLYGHPSATRLIQLKQGKLSEQDAAEVHQHFSKCVECAEFFAGYGEPRATECPKTCKKCAKKSAESGQVQAAVTAAPANSAHPSDGQLALLKEGHLAEADAAAVHQHFANCEQCAQAFVAMMAVSAEAEPAGAASVPATVAVAAAPAPANSAHPSDGQLALLKEGHLAEADAAAVHEHFANCEQCTQAFVAMMTVSAEAELATAASVPATVAVAAVPAPANAAHPSDGQLALLKSGVLSEAEAAAVHEHFAHCLDCTTAFASLDPAPAETAAPQVHVSVAVAAAPQPPAQASPKCASAKKRTCSDCCAQIIELSKRIDRLNGLLKSHIQAINQLEKPAAVRKARKP